MQNKNKMLTTIYIVAAILCKYMTWVLYDAELPEYLFAWRTNKAWTCNRDTVPFSIILRKLHVVLLHGIDAYGELTCYLSNF